MIAPGVSSTIRSTPVASLERADVAALAADDAALEVVARQVDDRDGGFDGVLGGAALDGVGDVLLGAVGGGLARLGVEPLDQVGGVVPRVGLDLLEQQLARLVGGQAGDALQLVLLVGDELLDCAWRRPRRASRGRATACVARAQLLSRAARSRPGARRARASCRRAPARAPAISCRRSRACRSASASELVRLLLGLEQRFLLAGFRRRARPP